MARVLAPTGRMVVSFVNYASLSTRVSRLWYRLDRARVPESAGAAALLGFAGAARAHVREHLSEHPGALRPVPGARARRRRLAAARRAGLGLVPRSPAAAHRRPGDPQPASRRAARAGAVRHGLRRLAATAADGRAGHRRGHAAAHGASRGAEPAAPHPHLADHAQRPGRSAASRPARPSAGLPLGVAHPSGDAGASRRRRKRSRTPASRAIPHAHGSTI